MKVCKVNGCENSVWSGDTCRRHTSYKPLQTNPVSKEKKEEKQIMRRFFLSMWRIAPDHYCEDCGIYLGKEPLSYMFDHVLEKQKYPQLKYEIENIQYLCLHCHDKKTRGFISEKTANKIAYIKNKFNIFD